MLHAAFLPLFILGAVVLAVFTLAWAICAIGGMADDEQQLGEREVEEREARDVNDRVQLRGSGQCRYDRSRPELPRRARPPTAASVATCWAR